VGEVVGNISQITSFTFYVSGLGGGTATAYIASWNLATNTASPPLAVVNVTLSNSNTAYTAVTATLNVANLTPTSAYVIYITLPPSVTPQYTFATTPSATTGAYVQATNGAWSAGFNQDVTFSLVSTNTLSLYYTSYSIGTSTTPNYACYYNTSYTTIQVNWQTSTINTNYNVGATTITIAGSCSSAGVYVPLGIANTCGWDYFEFVVDLRGTNYQIADTWVIAGWPAAQLGSDNYSNNNQTVTGDVNGDCSDIYPASANGNVVTGGMFIQIKYV